MLKAPTLHSTTSVSRKIHHAGSPYCTPCSSFLLKPLHNLYLPSPKKLNQARSSAVFFGFGLDPRLALALVVVVPTAQISLALPRFRIIIGFLGLHLVDAKDILLRSTERGFLVICSSSNKAVLVPLEWRLWFFSFVLHIQLVCPSKQNNNTLVRLSRLSLECGQKQKRSHPLACGFAA